MSRAIIGTALAVLVLATAGASVGPPTEGASAAGSVAYVQGTAVGDRTRAEAIGLRTSTAVRAGDLLVGWFSQFDAPGSVRVSDPVNGAWTRAPRSIPFGSSSGDNALYYVANAGRTTGPLTVTVSADGPTFLSAAVAEYSGIAPAAALDQMAVGRSTDGTLAVGPTASVAAGDLVFAAVITTGSPGDFLPGATRELPYRKRLQSESASVFAEDVTSSGRGPQVGSVTARAPADLLGVVATFRPAGARSSEPPPAPSGIRAASVSADAVALAWRSPDRSTPPASYTVYRNGVLLGTTAEPRYTDRDVIPASSYSYAVTAMSAAGETSAASPPLTVTTPPRPPGCDPKNLIASIDQANRLPGGATIDLAAGCTYTLGAADNLVDGPTGLPTITGAVTVNGHNATIERAGAADTPRFRLFTVAAGGVLTLNEVTLANGVADDGKVGGGAITNRGTVTVTKCRFTGNAATAPTGTSGGAIQNSGTLTVSASTFTAGRAQSGGGVFNQGTARISDSTFTDNAALAFGGGALYGGAGGTLTVTGSTFTGNTAPGGGALDNDATARVENSTMTDNSAGERGGGAVQDFGILDIVSSTIVGNRSPFGANLHVFGGAALTLRASIVADGVASPNCGGTAIRDAGRNLLSDSSCQITDPSSRRDVEPQAQPPADNGGPTATMALSPRSPAIDAIPAGECGADDQRHVRRPQGAACDIGAFELVRAGADRTPPSQPGGLAATSTDAGAVTVEWNPSTDDIAVASYVVYRGGQKVATVPAATAWYTDQSARPGITYRYAVEAVDGAGNRSARSAELPVTTGSAPPAPPRWRQGTVSNTGARVTGLTLRLNSPVAAGDLLVGWFGQFDSTGSVTVSDNVNGAWTRAPAATTFNGRGDVGLFYVPNAAYAGSGLTITVTASAPTFLQAVLAEYSGIAAANPLVTSVAVKDVSASAEALTTSVPAGSLVYAAITCGRSPNGATPAGGLAERSATPNGSTDDADVIATGGPQAAVWTFGAPVDWYAVSAVFRPAVP